MLLYAVASPRWARGDGFLHDLELSLNAPESNLLGFQPVFIHTIDAHSPQRIRTIPPES
jgi:hypothetical protein